MEDQNNKIGESRGNSISSGDPNLKTNQGNTSTDPTSSKNTGESAPQNGENIVNEQEQQKPVNMEEYIENSSQNRFDDQEKSNVSTDEYNDVDEVGDDTDETNNKKPTMNSGVL